MQDDLTYNSHICKGEDLDSQLSRNSRKLLWYVIPLSFASFSLSLHFPHCRQLFLFLPLILSYRYLLPLIHFTLLLLDDIIRNFNLFLDWLISSFFVDLLLPSQMVFIDYSWPSLRWSRCIKASLEVLRSF